jgi:hypothetical protein
LKVPLQTFVVTLREINKLPIVTVKKESLFNYNSFLEAKNILDNTGNGQSTPTTEKEDDKKEVSATASQAQSQNGSQDTGDQSKKILDFFNENCKEVRAFVISDEEITTLNKKMEESEKNNKGIIMGMDPIIEIMKLFIKAYKTYTVKTITKRTENVDTNTLSEYTSFGAQSADDTGRQGPYRNNKLFDLWENAVNDIRKDRKYQAIFTENAKLRLPKVTDPNPTNTEDWVIKPNAGAAFRKFINEVLDGDTLYKSGSTGAVATFIEKYFGDGSVSEKDGKGLQGTDLTEATEIATEIDKNSIKLKLKEVTDINPVANTFFTITGMKPGDATKPDIFDKPIQRSFFIDKNDGISVFMISSIFINQFNTLLTKLGPARVISKGDFVSSLNGTDTRGIEVTKVSKADFIKLKKDQKIKMVTLDKTGTQHTENIKIDNIYSLIKEEDSKVYTLSDEERTKFNPILKGTGIVDTDDKNAVENKVKFKAGTIITPI